MTGEDPKAALENLRDAIRRDLDACESMRDRAALYARLTVVLKDLRELESTAGTDEKGDRVDEIAKRRAARGRGA